MAAELWKIEYSVRCDDGDAFFWVDDDAEAAEAEARKASLENPDAVYTVQAERLYYPDRKDVAHFTNGAKSKGDEE